MTTIDFSLPTTDAPEKLRAFASLRGKVVLVFGESQQTQGQNAALMQRLELEAKARPELADKMTIVPVVELSNVPGIGRSLAWGMLKTEAAKAGLPLWADFDGAVSTQLGFRRSLSCVLLVSREGEVLWGYRGKLPPDKLEELMTELAKQLGVQG